jgi:quinol monooxygenase YgiN
MPGPGGEGGVETPIVVVALLKLKAGTAAEAIDAFRPVVEKTHTERGCQAYALHRDGGDPDTIVLIEKWASQADLDAHFVKPYIEDLGELSSKLLAEPPRILFCEPLAIGDPSKGMI